MYLSCMSVWVYGQQSSPESVVEKLPPRWAIKLAPLSILDFVDPTIQVGVEYLITPSLGIQQEVGFMRVKNWFNSNNTEEHPRNILRLRTELRYYSSLDRKTPYIALEGFYKHVSQQREQEIDQGNYWEKVSYTQIRNVLGFHFKIGWQFSLNHNERLIMDVYTGIGMRRIVAHTTNREKVPPALLSSDSFIDLQISGNKTYTLPSIALGFKIGYWL